MRVVVTFSLALSLLSLIHAAELEDRQAIQQTLEALNKRMSSGPETSIASFFTASADWSALRNMRETESPMAEVSPVRVNVQEIHMDPSGFATVEVELVQYGSLTFRRVPLVFTMSRFETAWLITGIRGTPPRARP